MSAAPAVSLPRFAGPLDLLLSLVRKKELDIADLPIAEITRQYLDYLDEAEELNIDLGAEFVYMAATLIQIKSRCLLPADPAQPSAGSEDPRQELVRELLDHEQVSHAAEILQQKLQVSQATWSHPPEPELGRRIEVDEEATADDGALNLLQVLRLAQQALAAARAYNLVTPPESVSVAEMMAWLEQRLDVHPTGLEAGPLLEDQPDASHRSALFLAMLEMANSRRIDLDQQECFGRIWMSMRCDTAQVCHNVKEAAGVDALKEAQ
jgi:segregation and condensation protein A